ncbi:MAG: hypothetical protein ACE5IK_14755 [Acidobacteriota bacterium]
MSWTGRVEARRGDIEPSGIASDPTDPGFSSPAHDGTGKAPAPGPGV